MTSVFLPYMTAEQRRALAVTFLNQSDEHAIAGRDELSAIDWGNACEASHFDDPDEDDDCEDDGPSLADKWQAETDREDAHLLEHEFAGDRQKLAAYRAEYPF